MDIGKWEQTKRWLTRPVKSKKLKDYHDDGSVEDYGPGYRPRSIPKDFVPVMPQAPGLQDPATSIKELATGGSVLTPKRGLVDGPGSYNGEKNFIRNPTGINQHKLRTVEEIQKAIDDAPPKYVPKKDGTLKKVPVTAKDLFGDGKNYPHKIISQSEYRKYKDKLDFEGTGRPSVEDPKKGNIVRYAKNKFRSNPTILAKMAGKEGYQLSHLSLFELDSLKNLGYLPKDINIKQYHSFEKKIVANAKEIYAVQNNKSLPLPEKRAKIAELQKKDRALRKQFPEYAKTKARLKVQANKLEASGLKIGEKLPDPTVAMSQTEGTPLKNIKTGSKKEKEILEMSTKALIEKTGIKPTDTKPTIIAKIKKASIPNKIKGSLLKAFNLGLGPTGMLGLTYGLRPEDGYDLSRAGDRLGFEAEAAFAKPLVKGSLSVTDKIKNPLARKIAERGSLALMSPAMALRLARVATPLGLASLGLEGVYHLGKYAKNRRAELAAMSPKERDELRRKSDDFSFGEYSGAAKGGLMSLTTTVAPTRGPVSQGEGLASLEKRAREY